MYGRMPGEICENEEINEIPYGSGTADISKIKSPTLVNDDYTGSETVYKVTTWDCVWFGNYYQTSSTAKTPVKWRVLDKDDTKNTAVLIADAVLDAQKYDEDGTSNGWSDATLREWLNTTMYQELFSEREKEAIVETDTTVKQEGDEDGEAATGSAISTTDRVYLLAESDFVNELYGLIQEDADVSPTCKAIATAYLEKKYPLLGAAGTVVNWWMRDKGYSVDSANYVDTTGTISEEYKEKLYGIRPVITVDLSKATLYDAGTVSSDGKIEEKAYPDNTTKDPGDNGNIGTKIRGSRILLQELIQQTIRQELRQVPAMRKRRIRSPINSMVVSMHRIRQPIPKEVQRSHCKRLREQDICLPAGIVMLSLRMP